MTQPTTSKKAVGLVFKTIDILVHIIHNDFILIMGGYGPMPDIEKDFVHLARLSVNGKTEDVSALFRRSATSLVQQRPDLVDEIATVLGMLDQTNISRSLTEPLPVDTDSRLELIRWDNSPKTAISPVWPKPVAAVLEEVISERCMEQRLWEAGIEPTKSLLFSGPPGTGKTLAATWLAEQLKFPLLTLDLSAVMSSFLGRTGNNIRVVLDYARRSPGVLLLDEFDALAKRRDDGLEIGELKRLVTVLLQEIDRWPTHGILIAATNHPDLLDPAVWRRFDRVLEFPLPTKSDLERLISQLVPETKTALIPSRLLASLFNGHSFSDVTRTIESANRSALVQDICIEDVMTQVAAGLCMSRPRRERLAFASLLAKTGISQRKIANLIGVSRDTLRKHLRSVADASAS